MCAVGEKLIQFPENCGVGSCFLDHDVTRNYYDYKYPAIIVETFTEWYDNPEFIANWDAWKPAWLEANMSNRTHVARYALFTIKAYRVENWCAECNVMQAQPCYQFRCAACDNEQWEKDVIEDAWYSWRELVDYSPCGGMSEHDDEYCRLGFFGV